MFDRASNLPLTHSIHSGKYQLQAWLNIFQLELIQHLFWKIYQIPKTQPRINSIFLKLRPLNQQIYTNKTPPVRVSAFMFLVDGGLSPWSLWTPCSAYCGSGTRTRKRKCNLPKRRCGGKDCDPIAKLSEEESCEGPCKGTRLIWPDANNLMLHSVIYKLNQFLLHAFIEPISVARYFFVCFDYIFQVIFDYQTCLLFLRLPHNIGDSSAVKDQLKSLGNFLNLL